MPGRVRVLHVIESYGAGTASAAAQHARATPDLEHHLLRRLRPDEDHADDGEGRLYATVADLAPGTLGAIASVRRRVRYLRPHVIHAHSSYGGAFTRLAVTRRGRRIVYTPHCFAMERADVSPLLRRGFTATERLLGLNTDVFAACSQRETELAQALAPRRRSIWVPNVCEVTLAHVPPGAGERHDLVAAGRVTAQRDPAFFRSVVEEVRRRGAATALWIGDGEAQEVARLRASGVTVTGWLPRSQALGLLAGAGVYVHTAAWDGAPMTILEAAALLRPVVARRSAALADVPDRLTGDSPPEVARLAVEVLGSERSAEANRSDWAAHLAGHTVEAQRRALLEAYGGGTRP